MEYIRHYDSPLGGITLASDGEALIGLWFDGQKFFADSLEKEYEEKDLPVFEETCRWLDIYFSGRQPDFTPPLRMKTTPFRKAVWEIMLTIPFGKTMTYGEIAARIAKQKGIQQMSAQAVGGAVGHNSISLVIPCHRVIGSNGDLTGYAGGLDLKVRLLELEQHRPYEPEATYFNSNGYSIVAKVENGRYILTREGWDEDPETKESLVVSVNDTARLKDRWR